MLEFENQNIEFKQEYVPDILKEIGFEMQRAAQFMLEYEKMEQFQLLAIGGAVIMAGVASLGTCFAFCLNWRNSKKAKRKKGLTHQALLRGCLKTTTAKYIDRSIGELSY